MQGYIIEIKPVRDDDLIVFILTQTELLTSYRFYGARHSNINIGYKIDFELETTKSTIPRLKNVIQLNFPWIFDTKKMYCFQNFIKLFHSHLKDVDSLEPFYYFLLEKLIYIMEKQDPQRAICESYLSLLDFEGRLHKELYCILCDKPILKNATLIRGFIPAHSQCAFGKEFSINKIQDILLNKKLILLNENEVEYLWDILLEGL